MKKGLIRKLALPIYLFVVGSIISAIVVPSVISCQKEKRRYPTPNKWVALSDNFEGGFEKSYLSYGDSRHLVIKYQYKHDKTVNLHFLAKGSDQIKTRLDKGVAFEIYLQGDWMPNTCGYHFKV